MECVKNVQGGIQFYKPFEGKPANTRKGAILIGSLFSNSVKTASMLGQTDDDFEKENSFHGKVSSVCAWFKETDVAMTFQNKSMKMLKKN